MRPIFSTLVLTPLLTGCAMPNYTYAPAPTTEAEVVTPSHPQLRQALLDLRQRDQTARKSMVELLSKQQPQPGGGFTLSGDDAKILRAVRKVDAESTAFLKDMVAEHGWPTFTMVGKDGARAAWILAQHADADRDFQARVLALMKPLVNRGQAHPNDFALLTDRVLLAKGEPQIYATQFTTDENGVQRPAPTRDWSTIDARRADVGLAPIAEYAESLRETYGGEVSTEPMPINAGE